MLPPSITSLPEAREEFAGQSIAERTSRLGHFADLGPPDLCTIQKQSLSLKHPSTVGTFLYFTGVDTSSSASIAAHLHGIANLLTQHGQYWFGEKKHWKVPQLDYCLYNAFSRVDMRVTVRFPGKLDASVVAADGKVLDVTDPETLDTWWIETFVGSIIRLVTDQNDDFNKAGGLVEMRKRNPFGYGPASAAMLDTFMLGFQRLFVHGHKLGCAVECAQPTIVSNLLVDGFLQVVKLTQHFDEALSLLQNLRATEPKVDSLIIQVLLMKDHEVEAVRLMTSHLEQWPRNADILVLQAEYCFSKKRPDMALPLSRHAVKASPLDFKTWACLVKAYTLLGDFENALLLLNSCPMNSHREQFTLKRVVPIQLALLLHLPSPTDVTLPLVSDVQSEEINAEQRALDPHLANLPAKNLKLTFKSAYDLLTNIVIQTGWKRLLEYRAKVFVMEEEYRRDRRAKLTAPALPNGELGPETEIAPEPAIKTDIPIETELDPQFNGNGDADQTVGSGDAQSTLGVISPRHSIADASPILNGQNEHDVLDTEFKQKRLCERWLDNLFILLYEDLRIYTLWQAEHVHLQAQQLEYKKSCVEWEALGNVACRLKHYEEGHQAFQQALLGRFLAGALWQVLQYYERELSKLATPSGAAKPLLLQVLVNLASAYIHNYSKRSQQYTERILECAINLLVWNHRWYCDFSPRVLEAISTLVAREGLIKVQLLVQAVYSNRIAQAGIHGVTELMDDIYSFLKAYLVSGIDN